MFHKYEFKAWEIAAYAFAYAGRGLYAMDALVIALHEQVRVSENRRPTSLAKAIEEANIWGEMHAEEEGRAANQISQGINYVAHDKVTYPKSYTILSAVDRSLLLLEITYAYKDEDGPAALYIYCDERANKKWFMRAVEEASAFTSRKDFIYPTQAVPA